MCTVTDVVLVALHYKRPWKALILFVPELSRPVHFIRFPLHLLL